MEVFFIVKQLGSNTGDLMNTLAKAAPEVAGVSEQSHRVGLAHRQSEELEGNI